MTYGLGAPSHLSDDCHDLACEFDNISNTIEARRAGFHDCIDTEAVCTERVADIVKFFKDRRATHGVILEYSDQGGIFVRGLVSRTQGWLHDTRGRQTRIRILEVVRK
jgi:hypothetical protein